MKTIIAAISLTCLTVGCVTSMAQTPVVTDPSGSQTIAQPAGTSLTITAGNGGNYPGPSTFQTDQLKVEMPYITIGANGNWGGPQSLSLNPNSPGGLLQTKLFMCS